MSKAHSFSRQLRDAMESRGLTNAELAELTGVDPAVIARFLSSERQVRSGTIDRIFEALDLRVVEVARARPGKKGKAR
jgi:transcriptional regulator with XRE-family HTH domain